MAGKTKAKMMSLIIICLIFSGAVAAAAEPYHKLNEKYPTESSKAEESTEKIYAAYLRDGEDRGYINADTRISVDLSTVLPENANAKLQSGGKVLSDENQKRLSFRFTARSSGYYNLQFTYTALTGSSESPRRGILIDGETPYRELNNIVFDRIWKDAGEPAVNGLGDMLRPRQVEVAGEQTLRVNDYLARSDEPLKIYLEPGEHTMELAYICEPMEISEISFVPPEVYETYALVAKTYEEKGYKPASSAVKIDAEKPYRKSDSSMRLEFSGDPKADPPSKGQYILNAIGGTRWNKGNQTISYRFRITEPGLYKIGLRCYQKYNDGLDSYRQIRIDGKVPFRELLCYRFAYGDWENTVLSDDGGEPYLFYFAKGEHELELTVKISPYAEILNDMEYTLEDLSRVIQGVIKITGISPDPNFEYELDKKLPWLMERLRDISDDLGGQIEALKANARKNPGPVNSISEIRYKIDRMIKDPFIIPKNLAGMIDSQTTLSTWIRSFNNSPLMLDYIEIAPPDAELERGRSNALQILGVTLRNFLQSFIKDYDSISGLDGGEYEGKPLSVWVSRGKEWGEILKQISDEEFTERTGVPVNMNILPAGQLGTGGVMLLAVASGTAPDLVVGSDMTVPAEYGMRGALLNLAEQPGFDQVQARFPEGAMTPYRFEGGVYALPETIDFSIMYYRKDILDELNLSPPKTWEDLYQKVLPVLKRNGMDFGYEGGVNTFLFQNGGDFYTADGRRSALSSQAAILSFKQFTELYTVYQVPYEANFYSRFRAGQMPIGISSFTTYLMLTSAAPELQGKWDVALIPGTERGGKTDNSNSITTTSTMIFASCKDKAAAWDFVNWYTGEETQARYAADLVAYIGPEARWASANTAAFDRMSWESSFKEVLAVQRRCGRGMPSVIGGYITARHLENARVRTVLQGVNYRTSIEQAARDITAELEHKRLEFEH